MALVVESWAKVKAIDNYEEVAGELLFKKIFEINPDATALFEFANDFEASDEAMYKTEAFKQHATGVIKSVTKAVELLQQNQMNDLTEILQTLGAKHAHLNLEAPHFELVGDALLQTLAAALGEAFTDETKAAWTGVYGVITQHMMEGASNHVAQQLVRNSFRLSFVSEAVVDEIAKEEMEDSNEEKKAEEMDELQPHDEAETARNAVTAALELSAQQAKQNADAIANEVTKALDEASKFAQKKAQDAAKANHNEIQKTEQQISTVVKEEVETNNRTVSDATQSAQKAVDAAFQKTIDDAKMTMADVQQRQTKETNKVETIPDQLAKSLPDETAQRKVSNAIELSLQKAKQDNSLKQQAKTEQAARAAVNSAFEKGIRDAQKKMKQQPAAAQKPMEPQSRSAPIVAKTSSDPAFERIVLVTLMFAFFIVFAFTTATLHQNGGSLSMTAPFQMPALQTTMQTPPNSARVEDASPLTASQQKRKRNPIVRFFSKMKGRISQK